MEVQAREKKGWEKLFACFANLLQLTEQPRNFSL